MKKKNFHSIESTIENYKNMTDEEKGTNTTSLDELLKDMENEDNEENG